MFKAAIKAITLRSNDAPEPEARRRRSGEKEGGGPLCVTGHISRHGGKSAARGRYAALQPGRVALEAVAAASAPYAAAPVSLCDTLDWFNLWQANANNEQWHDGDFSAKKDHYFPQP